MQVAKKTKNLGIRASNVERTKYKQAALDRGITVQRLFELAMDSYISATKATLPDGKVAKVTEFPMMAPAKACTIFLEKRALNKAGLALVGTL